MGFFDNFKSKKKDDFGFTPTTGAGLGEPPIDSHSTLNTGESNVFTSPSSPTSQPNTGLGQHQPLDHRMSMPLGDSLNQPHSGLNSEAPTQFQPNNQNPIKQDFELLSSKLDYLKASIEAVNQRLANIEHLVRQEQEKKKW